MQEEKGTSKWGCMRIILGYRHRVSRISGVGFRAYDLVFRVQRYSVQMQEPSGQDNRACNGNSLL